MLMMLIMTIHDYRCPAKTIIILGLFVILMDTPILTNRHVCQSQLVTSHHMVFSDGDAHCLSTGSNNQ